jgi:hypothetical protein
MAMTREDTFNEYVECTVCGSDTARLCSPCGDPVCHNCACPNGCEAALLEPPARRSPAFWHADLAA